MNFNYNVLRGNIRANFEKESDFAKALGITPATLSSKLNNKSEFTQQEIVKAQQILNLTKIQVVENFFTH